MTELPPPRWPASRVIGALAAHGVGPGHPARVLASRGYYRDSVGVVGANDRDAYDDAIFLVVGDKVTSYRANTDPSPWGRNPRTGKGYAMLTPGVWWYRRDWHKKGRRGGHLAYVQAQPVVVDRRLRPGDAPVLDRGWFGLNLHRGGIVRPGSEGCQTLSPAPWSLFDQRLAAALVAYGVSAFPYVLIEAQG